MPTYNYINETGVIIVDTAAILLQVQTEYKAIFGADLIVTPNTPQGMLIAAETLARIALADNNAKLANQINPNLAGGVFLDAVMALTNPFGRLPALQSVVFATINGVAGTVIPAGSIASETSSGDNNQFFTLNDVTIPDSGSLPNVQFNSIAYGPIPSNTGTLTTIVTSVLGWETITNSSAAILGRLTQSDLDARLYRLNTLATQGASTAQAITSEILRITNTTSMSFLENNSSSSQTIEGVTMVANSIYVCVTDTVVSDFGTNSQVNAVVTGTPTTVIPSGSQVSSNGFVFQTSMNYTIPGSGTLTPVLFTALQTGPIPVPVNSLTTIVTPVSGWATVNNTVVATVGNPSPIASAIVSKKSAGAAFNNGPGTNINTVISVPFSGQLMTVLFDVAVAVPILVLVNIKILTSVQNATTAVQNAIIAYAAGQIDGVAGLTVGQNVSAFELSGAIMTVNPGIYVQSLFIAISPTSPTSPTEITISPYQIAQISSSSIIVNVVS